MIMLMEKWKELNLRTAYTDWECVYVKLLMGWGQMQEVTVISTCL